jgi:HD-GYP domain-containing protein (c-di-GMP phosphodiesterase class II)
VADVAEALSSDRPYRPALSLEQVLTIVRGAASRTLDGDACIALEDVLPEWAAEAGAAPGAPGRG